MEVDTTSSLLPDNPSGVGPIMHPTQGGFTGRAIGIIILSTWIILLNLVIIMAVLASEKHRKVCFNIHIINLCLASLLMGCVVLPFLIDFEVQGMWKHSDNMCRFWLICDLLTCTSSVLVVGMMVFDRFVVFACTGIARGAGQYVFSAAVFVAPWAIGAAFVVPVYIAGEKGPGVDAGNGICYLSLEHGYSVLSLLGGFFIPAITSFGILVAMTMTVFVRRDDLNRMEQLEEIKDKGWQVLMSWLQCFIVLLMWTPFNAAFLLHIMLNEEWPLKYLEPTMWIAYANAGIIPLIWLVMPSVRQAVRRLCCCCRPKIPRRSTVFRTDYTYDDDPNVSMLEFRYKRHEDTAAKIYQQYKRSGSTGTTSKDYHLSFAGPDTTPRYEYYKTKR